MNFTLQLPNSDNDIFDDEQLRYLLDTVASSTFPIEFLMTREILTSLELTKDVQLFEDALDLASRESVDSELSVIFTHCISLQSTEIASKLLDEFKRRFEDAPQAFPLYAPLLKCIEEKDDTFFDLFIEQYKMLSPGYFDELIVHALKQENLHAVKTLTQKAELLQYYAQNDEELTEERFLSLFRVPTSIEVLEYMCKRASNHYISLSYEVDNALLSALRIATTMNNQTCATRIFDTLFSRHDGKLSDTVQEQLPSVLQLSASSETENFAYLTEFLPKLHNFSSDIRRVFLDPTKESLAFFMEEFEHPEKDSHLLEELASSIIHFSSKSTDTDVFMYLLTKSPASSEIRIRPESIGVLANARENSDLFKEVFMSRPESVECCISDLYRISEAYQSLFENEPVSALFEKFSTQQLFDAAHNTASTRPIFQHEILMVLSERLLEKSASHKLDENHEKVLNQLLDPSSTLSKSISFGLFDDLSASIDDFLDKNAARVLRNKRL